MDDSQIDLIPDTAVAGTRSPWLLAAFTRGEVELSKFSQKMLEREDRKRAERKMRKKTRKKQEREMNRASWRTRKVPLNEIKKQREHQPKYRYLRLKRRAKEKGVPFTLTVNDWQRITKMLVELTGTPWLPGTEVWIKDRELGYSLGNLSFFYRGALLLEV